jgi:coproporphyrinogen III oxidase-like Fe-S oxidoreductase
LAIVEHEATRVAKPVGAATDAAFGVYIHWPFCLSKCPYCDFNSHVRHGAIDEARFVRAFAAEIAATAARTPGRTVSTIFFGGGTPSLMQPATVGALLDAVGRHWRIAPDVEVTLEANPTSVEATRFAGYRAAAGLPAYEISNHARPGAECRHNLIYWRYQEYAGIGPGAHGRLDIGGRRHATATERRPEAWLARVESTGTGVVTDEALSRVETADEFLLMGLRLAEGIDLDRFAALAGAPLAHKQIADLAMHGLVETTPQGRLRVTAAGFPLLDAIVADLAA